MEWNDASINIRCIFRNGGVVSTDVVLKMEKTLFGKNTKKKRQSKTTGFDRGNLIFRRALGKDHLNYFDPVFEAAVKYAYTPAHKHYMLIVDAC